MSKSSYQHYSLLLQLTHTLRRILLLLPQALIHCQVTFGDGGPFCTGGGEYKDDMQVT